MPASEDCDRTAMYYLNASRAISNGCTGFAPKPRNHLARPDYSATRYEARGSRHAPEAAFLRRETDPMILALDNAGGPEQIGRVSPPARLRKDADEPMHKDVKSDHAASLRNGD